MRPGTKWGHRVSSARLVYRTNEQQVEMAEKLLQFIKEATAKTGNAPTWKMSLRLAVHHDFGANPLVGTPVAFTSRARVAGRPAGDILRPPGRARDWVQLQVLNLNNIKVLTVCMDCHKRFPQASVELLR
jgi:hypothetical protein